MLAKPPNGGLLYVAIEWVEFFNALPKSYIVAMDKGFGVIRRIASEGYIAMEV